MKKYLISIITSVVMVTAILGVTPAYTQALDTSALPTPEQRCAYLAYLIGTSAESRYQTCKVVWQDYLYLYSQGYTGSIESILTEPLPTPPATDPTPTPTPTPVATPTAEPTATPAPAAKPTSTPQITPVESKEANKPKSTVKAATATVANTTPSPSPSAEPTYTLTQTTKTVKKVRPAFDIQLPGIGIILALAGLSALAAVYFAASREDEARK